MSNDEWTKVEPAPSWNGKDEDGNFTLEPGDTIQGIYREKKEDIGTNKGNLYEIETDDGVIGVWGSTVLNTRFKKLEKGKMVKIVYKGEVESKTGRKYYDYDVYMKPAPFNKVDSEDNDVEPEDVAF